MEVVVVEEEEEEVVVGVAGEAEAEAEGDEQARARLAGRQGACGAPLPRAARAGRWSGAQT